MQSIKYNKESHPILNQIYDILADLQKKKRFPSTEELGKMKKQIKWQNKHKIWGGVTTTEL